jgi:hypothetical protein
MENPHGDHDPVDAREERRDGEDGQHGTFVS